MSQISSHEMLANMQRLANQARSETQAPAAGEGNGFDAVLKNMVQRVNETQQEGKALSNAFSRADEQVDLAQAMVAMQKARVHFEAMVQVRNRLVSAYEEIMRMPV